LAVRNNAHEPLGSIPLRPRRHRPHPRGLRLPLDRDYSSARQAPADAAVRTRPLRVPHDSAVHQTVRPQAQFAAQPTRRSPQGETGFPEREPGFHPQETSRPLERSSTSCSSRSRSRRACTRRSARASCEAFIHPPRIHTYVLRGIDSVCSAAVHAAM
jgi:hypothetical protein